MTTEIVKVDNTNLSVSKEFMEAVRKTLNPQATDSEIAVFAKIAEQNGLSAFSEMSLIKGPTGKCSAYVNKYGLFRKLNERNILPLQPRMEPAKNPLTGTDDIKIIAPFEFADGKVREWHIWASEYSHHKGKGAYAQFPVQMLYTRAQTYAARQICNIGVPSVEEMEAVWERKDTATTAPGNPAPTAGSSDAATTTPKLVNAALTAQSPAVPSDSHQTPLPKPGEKVKGRPVTTWPWLKDRITHVRDIETADRFYQRHLQHAERFGREAEFRRLYEAQKEAIAAAAKPKAKVDDPGEAIAEAGWEEVVAELDDVLHELGMDDLSLCDLFMEDDGHMPYTDDQKIPVAVLSAKLKELKGRLTEEA